MPQIPNVDSFTELSFIVNYFLQGCEPPFWLNVELSRKPATDLTLLLITPDLVDIGQAIFDPKGQRNRRSGRHGRKSGRFKGFPDTSDIIGSRIRARINPYNALNTIGTRFVFKLINVYERVAITAALVDGLTDIGFANMWGMMQLHPELCPTMPYLTRFAPGPKSMVGVAPPTTPIGVDHLENKNRFISDDGISWQCNDMDYTVAAEARVYSPIEGGVKNFRLTIRTAEGGVLGESYAADIDEGDSVSLAVEAEVPKGVSSFLARTVESGSVHLYDVQVMAFGGTWF